MRILFLSQRVPEPPNKGDRIRAHHLMRRIAARHEVHLAFLIDDPAEAENAAGAERWAASVTWRARRRAESWGRSALSLVGGEPLTVGYFRSAALASDLRRVLARPLDVVVAYCSSMADYVRFHEGPRVLDLVDVDSEKWRQYAERARAPRSVVYALEHRRLRAYERSLVSAFDRTVLVSERERDALADFADVQRVAVVRNGVEAERFRRSTPRTREPRIVFIGALDYFPNADGIAHFARHVMPVVRQRVEGLTLRVVGRKPPPEIRALVGLPGVEIVGEVDDVRPELWGACAAVVPLRIARGVQNKVLEAMAAGLPVITSPDGVGGVDAEPGRHVLLARDGDDWAREIARVVDRPDEGDELGERAAARVRERHSWERSARDYEAVFEEARLAWREARRAA